MGIAVDTSIIWPTALTFSPCLQKSVARAVARNGVVGGIWQIMGPGGPCQGNPFILDLAPQCPLLPQWAAVHVALLQLTSPTHWPQQLDAICVR